MLIMALFKAQVVSKIVPVHMSFIPIRSKEALWGHPKTCTSVYMGDETFSIVK